VVGDGKYRHFFQKRVSSTNCKFLGKREDVCSILKTADVFIHSTFLDNFPYSILEAMACKKPIISVPVGGIPELLTGCGLLVAPTANELFTRHAPIMLVFTDVFARNSVKYQSREYRHAFWDCGTILANTLAITTAHKIPSKNYKSR